MGARTLVFTTGDVGQLPEATGNPAAPIGTAYSQNYNAQMQAALAAIARSGRPRRTGRISALLGNLIKANPAKYGVANVGACPLACIGNPALQNQYLFYFDGIHLTSLGFTIVGEYIVNRLNAPLTLPAQGDIGLNSAMGFASTLFGKLDNFREMSVVSSAMNAYAAYTKVPYTKAPIPAPVNPWSFYMLGNGAYSDRQATVASNGFNLDSVGGTIGTEYRINNNAFVGAAFDYSNPKAKFFNNAGTTEANAYQFGAYGAWANAHFFAQGLATYGWQNYRNTRPGVVDTITSNPDGTSFVAAGKVGYLFDAGRSQIGPIGGLTYARARVNGYTESRRSRADPERRPADGGNPDRQRRRAIPLSVPGQRPDDQSLRQPDDGRRFHRQRTDHPVRGDIGAADRQQLDGTERDVATRLRSRRGRRGGAGFEQRRADGEYIADLRAPGRQ